MKTPITLKAWFVAQAVSTVCVLISLGCGGKNLLLTEGALWLISLVCTLHEAKKPAAKQWVPDKRLGLEDSVINMKCVRVRA